MAAEKDEVVLASLLRTINQTRKCPDELKLGMIEWTDSDSDKENFQPRTQEAQCSNEKERTFFRACVSQATRSHVDVEGCCAN